MAAKAGTPADHRALEEYFLTLAKRYTAEANEHVAMAQAYRGTRIAQAAVHCDRLVGLSRDAAKEATDGCGDAQTAGRRGSVTHLHARSGPALLRRPGESGMKHAVMS